MSRRPMVLVWRSFTALEQTKNWHRLPQQSFSPRESKVLCTRDVWIGGTVVWGATNMAHPPPNCSFCCSEQETMYPSTPRKSWLRR
ncbi:hypothetical protein XELAEV_18022610mg [Xenopus laevis]|uniref:Uncharacterized protein n=1 Tax=Xenopus laevis TaxID=8355 RepID=A0A974D3J8_XENLA|nr:hypothetical protein XELAEV_18022610mg [Xenopus laevis]